MRSSVQLLLFGITAAHCQAWMVGPSSAALRPAPSLLASHVLNMAETCDDGGDNRVQSVSLKSMYESLSDPNKFGQELADSVQRWLDAEWMPLTIHQKMGESCKASFLQCEKEGVDDLMAVMMAVANDLQDDWQTEYEKDAFVNAWDVSNYVSDYLTRKCGIEGCECSARIH